MLIPSNGTVRKMSERREMDPKKENGHCPPIGFLITSPRLINNNNSVEIGEELDFIDHLASSPQLARRGTLCDRI